jgi:hypothetical protein
MIALMIETFNTSETSVNFYAAARTWNLTKHGELGEIS